MLIILRGSAKASVAHSHAILGSHGPDALAKSSSTHTPDEVPMPFLGSDNYRNSLKEEREGSLRSHI